MRAKQEFPVSTTEFAERLKTVRKRLGMTQEDLATVAGLSPITLSKLESGVNKPSFDVLWAIVIATKVEPNYFFAWNSKYSSLSNTERRLRLQELVLVAENLDEKWLDQIISLCEMAAKSH